MSMAYGGFEGPCHTFKASRDLNGPATQLARRAGRLAPAAASTGGLQQRLDGLYIFLFP